MRSIYSQAQEESCTAGCVRPSLTASAALQQPGVPSTGAAQVTVTDLLLPKPQVGAANKMSLLGHTCALFAGQPRYCM